VNDVASSISQLGYDVTTYQAGCPGLSAAATISGIRCNGDGISSLQRALNFLTLHVNDHVIVTVDLGFNDLRFCRASEFKNPSCALKVMPQIEQSVTTVIQALQSVAGPNTTIYGMTHDNPYLGRSASGNSSLAAQSVPAMNALNDTLRRVYAANNVGLVDVAAAFETSNVQPMYLTGMGVVPTNVARICTYTFICAMPPYGPNLHPNVAGYQVIAQTIMSVLSL
jgi:lysophospholipase L1-like esterase